MLNIFKNHDDCLHHPDWYSCSPLLNCSDEQRRAVQGRFWVNTYCVGSTLLQTIQTIVQKTFNQIPEETQSVIMEHKYFLLFGSLALFAGLHRCFNTSAQKTSTSYKTRICQAIKTPFYNLAKICCCASISSIYSFTAAHVINYGDRRSAISLVFAAITPLLFGILIVNEYQLLKTKQEKDRAYAPLRSNLEYVLEKECPKAIDSFLNNNSNTPLRPGDAKRLCQLLNKLPPGLNNYYKGIAYRNGILEKDDRQAMKCFKEAFKQGNAEAAHELGLYYDTGAANVKPCRKMALQYMMAAANLGHGSAKFWVTSYFTSEAMRLRG